MSFTFVTIFHFFSNTVLFSHQMHYLFSYLSEDIENMPDNSFCSFELPMPSEPVLCFVSSQKSFLRPHLEMKWSEAHPTPGWARGACGLPGLAMGWPNVWLAFWWRFPNTRPKLVSLESPSCCLERCKHWDRVRGGGSALSGPLALRSLYSPQYPACGRCPQRQGFISSSEFSGSHTG